MTFEEALLEAQNVNGTTVKYWGWAQTGTVLHLTSNSLSRLRALVRPAWRVVRGLRLFLFPARAWRFYALSRVGAFFRTDPLRFMKREHYLSRFFGVRQRIDSTLQHYQHELASFDETYRTQVYRGNGLVLHEERVGDGCASRRLGESGEPRCEGDLTVVMDVDGQDAAFMSYSFVDAACFGLPSGTALFVTRNQLMPGLNLFRRYYPNHSPQYFCLAAIAGIARANDFDSIVVIRSEAQVSYQDQYEAGFRNSYCNFWSQFGARPIDHQAYVLDVPLTPPSLDSVASKHRARAIERRSHWSRITQQVEAAMRAHRTNRLS